MREKLEALAALIGDYRDGEIPKPDVAHVDKWVSQFEPDEREPLIEELVRIWAYLYIKKETLQSFIQIVLRSKSVTGPDPREFWSRANVMNIQRRGLSQFEMRNLFQPIMSREFGFGINESATGPDFVYLDDIMFTGDRIEQDLYHWVKSAPDGSKVTVIVYVSHAYGKYQLGEKLKSLGKIHNKNISFRLLARHTLENRRSYRESSKVLWPSSLPSGAEHFSVGATGFSPRPTGHVSKLFPSEGRRHLVEQALLRAGMRIIGLSREPDENLRPLGYSPFGVGFGSLLLSYRNCPNNAPLALWWGDRSKPASHPLGQWYPLVPRKQ
jgi:hypothetical protein